MHNLTDSQKAQLVIDFEKYLELCPPKAKKHTLRNLEGFIAGWTCRAAFENDRKENETLTLAKKITIVTEL